MILDISKAARQICLKAPIIPVLVVENVADAVPLAKALIAGGLPVLEVTLRTDAALDVIREMATCEGAIVGAGTLLSAEDFHAAKEAGAQFGVSPGITNTLIDAAKSTEMPLLPGASTASEVMSLLEAGFDMLKFFPAEANGGVSSLKSLASPLPSANFCPTGGVNTANVKDYLALPNVVCAGGSWMAPKAMIDNGEWDGIENLAREAVALAT